MAFDQIQHIFVLMVENCSFDHLLGFADISGTDFVERNYNLVELGPRGTGKSHLFQQISPYSHLISGGKATVVKMFVNNASG